MSAAGPRVVLREGASLIYEAYKDWKRDRASGLAAAATLFGLVAAPSLIAVMLLVAAAIAGQARVSRYLVPMIFDWVGPNSAEFFQTALAEVNALRPDDEWDLGLFVTLGLFFGTAAYFTQIKESIETIWDIRRSDAGIAAWVRDRITSAAAALGTIVIIILSLTLHAPLSWLAAGNAIAIRAIELLLVFGCFFASTIFYFRCFVPVRVRWRDMVFGAAVTAALMLLGRLVADYYFIGRGYSNIGGAAAGMAAVLLWFYYSTMMLLYGAELTRLYAYRHGSLRAAPPEEELKAAPGAGGAHWR